MKIRRIDLAIGALVLAVGAYWAVAHFSRHSAEGTDESVATQPAASSPTPTAQPTPQGPVVNAGYPFQDTSMLKPPAGARVAIWEFEDLECPACARAFPVVHAAAAQYKIPLERHDYPWYFHAWALDAAVTARYIQDKISPALADQFRSDVFANQTAIAGKDDLDRFTQAWFKQHHQSLPFVMDAACRNEVLSDQSMGDRLGVKSTPCIFVVTKTKWVPVVDLSQLGSVIDSALADSGSPAA